MKKATRLIRVLALGGAFTLTTVLGGAVNAAEADPGAGDFVQGAKSWAQNCARCHNMRDPKEFRDDLWKPIVTHMRVRAGLTGQEARDILEFLQRSN